MRHYRQGDVLLIEIPEAEFQTSGMQREKRPTLALGEATGHHHTFEGDVEVYTEMSDLSINEKGAVVRVNGEEALLTHQEHATIAVPKGTYRRVIQREYSPAGIRNVLD